jgi:hypothetical protein
MKYIFDYKLISPITMIDNIKYEVEISSEIKLSENKYEYEIKRSYVNSNTVNELFNNQSKGYITIQFYNLIQILLNKISKDLTDSEKIEFANLYPIYELNKKYEIGNIISYGLNGYNEIQLYEVIQDHISDNNRKPDEVSAIYRKLGFIKEYNIWTKPICELDAYDKDDIVIYYNKIYKSLKDINESEPGNSDWEQIF